MFVYYVTTLIIIILACVSQYFDKMYVDTIDNEFLDNGKIVHSSKTLYAFIALTLVLIFVAGLRYSVGADYWAYYLGNIRYTNRLLESIIKLKEPGYCLICYISSFYNNDPAVSIFLAAFFTISISMIVIYYNTKQIALAILFFMFLGCWLATFNAIRQCLAATFVFMGYPYIKNKKIIKFIICIFIAYLFHRSALCMISIYFLFHLKINYRNLLILLIVSVILSYSYSKIFEFTEILLEGHEFKIIDLDNYFTRRVNMLRVISYMAPTIYFYVLYINGKLKNKCYHTMNINILLINLLLTIISKNSPYLMRLNIYIQFFMTISLAELIKDMCVVDKNIIVLFICFLYCIFFFYEVQHSVYLNNFLWIWER